MINEFEDDDPFSEYMFEQQNPHHTQKDLVYDLSNPQKHGEYFFMEPKEVEPAYEESPHQEIEYVKPQSRKASSQSSEEERVSVREQAPVQQQE